MGSNWLGIAVVLVLTYGGGYGVHFRGGSFSWRPLSSTQIELKYRVGFTAEFEPTEGETCTEQKIVERTPLNIRGSAGLLVCDECEGENKKFDWVCDGIDRSEDSAWGSYSYVYDVPEPVFEISNQGCCWIDLESPVGSGGARGWKMLAHVDMKPHLTTGRLNSSPVPAAVPLEKFYRGCDYNLKIAASDPDGDDVRCRYADIRKGECHDSHTKACGPPTDGLTINSKSCIMYFNTDNIAPGYHAVNVIIEDYVKPVTRKSKPMSKVSLLFLMEVGEYSETCPKPLIIDPPAKCIAARPGQTTDLIIKADPGDASKPIAKIRAQGPMGMSKSTMVSDPAYPGRKRMTLSWTPTTEHLGEAWPISYSAIDADRYTSGVQFTFIYVTNDEPLQVEPVRSNPGPGAELTGIPYIFHLTFNNQIRKPEDVAYITLRNVDTGEVIYQINAAGRSKTVQHSGSKMIVIFSDVKGLIRRDTRVRIELDEGVAVPADGRGCGSLPAQWEFTLLAKLTTPEPTTTMEPTTTLEPTTTMEPTTTLEPTTTMEPTTMTPFVPTSKPLDRPVACIGNTMTMPIPDEVQPGDKCFVHVMDKGTVVGGQINTHFKLCCNANCSETAIPVAGER